MELDLVILSTIREPGPPLWLGWTGSAPRVDRERNKLLRFDSLAVPGADWREVILSTRRSRPPNTSPADDVVGVEAAVEDGAGGLGSWALERRWAVFEKPGLNRPAVA